MLEWYEAYADYDKTAHDMELLVAEVAERVLGTTESSSATASRSTSRRPGAGVTLREAILERAGIDVAEHPTREALADGDRAPSPTRRRAGGSWSTACSPSRSSRR